MKFATVVDEYGVLWWSNKYQYHAERKQDMPKVVRIICPGCGRDVHRAGGTWVPKRGMLRKIYEKFYASDTAQGIALAVREDRTLVVYLEAMFDDGLLKYTSEKFSVSFLKELSEIDAVYPYFAHEERIGDCPLENWNESGQPNERERPADSNWHRVLQEKAALVGHKAEVKLGHYRVDIQHAMRPSEIIELEHTHLADREKIAYLGAGIRPYTLTLLQSPTKSLRKKLVLCNPFNHEDNVRIREASRRHQRELVDNYISDTSANPQWCLFGILGSMRSTIAWRGVHPSMHAIHIPEYRAFGTVCQTNWGFAMKGFSTPWKSLAQEIAQSDIS